MIVNERSAKKASERLGNVGGRGSSPQPQIVALRPRMAPAEAFADANSDVEVVAGLDADQLLAALRLHEAWAFEESGQPLDAHLWASDVRAMAGGGRYTVLVAWAGKEPVAVLEGYVFPDCRTGELICQGDRLYVLPKWRRSGVLKALLDASEHLMRWMGCARQRVSIRVQNKHLLRFCKAFGLEDEERILERRL